MSEQEYRPAAEVLAPATETMPREVTLGGLVLAVACYYDRPVRELVDGSHTRDPQLQDARNAMLTLISDNGLMDDQELAQQLGRKPNMLKRRLDRTRDRAAEDPKFKAHLEGLTAAATGEPLLETVSFWPELVAMHYDDLTAEQIASSSQHKPSEARQVIAYLLSEKTVIRPSVIIKRANLGGYSEVPHAVRRIARLRQADKVFDRQIATLEDGLLPVPPKLEARRVMVNTHSFYGVNPETVPEGKSPTSLDRPKAVNAYLLRERLGLSVQETREALDISSSTVTRLTGIIKDEMADNPMLAAEIDYIENAEAVDFSINDRIVELVAQVTGKDKADVMAGLEADDLYARRMAMSLIAERGHAYAPEIAKFFGFAREGVVRRARFLIKRQLLESPLLNEQMAWVRGQIFSQKPAPFVFQDGEPGEAKAVALVGEGDLPDIDERLVHPNIKEAVYEIIRDTATYYNRPAIKVMGRDVSDFMTRRARRAAMLRCQQARLPMAEVGICFDNREHSSALDLAKTAADVAARKRVFAEEIEALARGEKPRNRVAETLGSVRGYYEINQAELKRGRTRKAIRARAAFIAIMNEYDCVGRDQLGKAIGSKRGTISPLLRTAAKLLKNNSRFRAEVQYLMSPDNAPRPPEAEDIVMKIYESYGVAAEDLSQPQTPEALEAAQMTAYILADELPITPKKVASVLGCSQREASDHIDQVKRQIADDPRLILKIDALRPAGAASHSMVGKILRFTAGRHKLGVAELLDSAPSPQTLKARREVEQLLGRYAGYSASQAARLFPSIQPSHVNGNGNGNGNANGAVAVA